MPWPPSVRVVFSHSTTAVALIAALAIATCAIIAVLPFEPAAIGLAMMGVVTWAVDRIYVVALRQGPRAVRELELRGDLTVIVVNGAGAPIAGRVRNESYVGARLTTLVWRPFGRWRSRTIFVLPDMLPAQDFRRLRVLLRYGRSDVTQGRPANQP